MIIQGQGALNLHNLLRINLNGDCERKVLRLHHQRDVGHQVLIGEARGLGCPIAW